MADCQSRTLLVRIGFAYYITILSALTALSTRVLIHPNTNDSYKDHTELMSWMGKPYPLYVDMLKRE